MRNELNEKNAIIKHVCSFVCSKMLTLCELWLMDGTAIMASIYWMDLLDDEEGVAVAKTAYKAIQCLANIVLNEYY